MILFDEDWTTKHPHAIADYTTKNTSFIEVALLFKDMGLKNYDFPLALHNKELQGVDPFSPDLTAEQNRLIFIECHENIWYYLRECAMIPPLGGSTPIHYIANRGNMAMTWLAMNHITNMQLQIRQTGKSVSANHISLWVVLVGTRNASVGLFTKDSGLRNKNISIYKEIYSYLPAMLQLRSKREPGGDEKFVVSVNKNEIETAVPQISIAGARNVFRGASKPVIQIDEICYINNIDISLSPLLGSTTAAREAAERNGSPYFTLYTTTPGYLTQPSGIFGYEIYNSSFRFTEKLYDTKNRQDLESVIRKNNSGLLRVVTEFNHRQLGFTDEWLKRRIEATESKGSDLEADWLLIWPQGNSISPLSADILKRIQESIRTEYDVEISKNGYLLRHYVDKKRIAEYKNGKPLVGGLDPSDAVGRDDMSLVVADPTTGETVAAADVNETNIITFSEWLVNILTDYSGLILVIERRGSGSSIIDNLLKILPMLGIDPFKRLFNWITNEQSRSKTSNDILSIPFSTRPKSVYDRSDVRLAFGFATSKSGKASREMLYGNVFSTATKYLSSVIRDKKLATQLSTLTVKNGRIDHTHGGHDDMVIAWLLIYWFLTIGESHKMYGLNPKEILSNVGNNIVEKSFNKVEKAENEEQKYILSAINDLIEEMRNEPEPNLFIRLQNRLMRLLKDYKPKPTSALTISEIMDRIETLKKIRRRR